MAFPASRGVLTHVDEAVVKGFENYLDREGLLDTEETSGGEESQETKAVVEREDEQTEQTEEREEEREEEQEEEQEDEQTEETEETAEESDDDDVINTLADLAQSFEVEEAELLDHLQVPGNDGTESVSLSEVIKFYQNGPATTEVNREEIDAERVELRQASDKNMKELIDMTARVARLVETQQEPEGGWDKLREENAGEYIRLKELYEGRRHEAEEAIALMDQETARRIKEDKEQYDRFVDTETKRTFQLRPDWTDAKIAKAAHEDINGYLKRHGFASDEIEGLVQAKQIITVWKAAQYDKAQAAKPRVKKRLGKLPRKHLKASARDETVRSSAQDKRRKAVIDKFSKSGKLEDSLALFGEHV